MKPRFLDVHGMNALAIFAVFALDRGKAVTKNAGKKDEAGDVDPTIALGLLAALEREERITQRSLAKELGIALGLANAYLKHAVVKGWVKVQQLPLNRYAYFLTPKGLREKAKLTADYLQGSFTFFRHSKEQLLLELNQFASAGQERIILVGVSELAEIASLLKRESKIEILGIVDSKSAKDSFAGLTVAQRPEELPAADAFLITDLTVPQALYWSYVHRYGAARVRAPEMLNVHRKMLEPLASNLSAQANEKARL